MRYDFSQFDLYNQYHKAYYSPPNPVLAEKRSIMRTVSVVGIVMLIYIILASIVPKAVLVSMLAIGFPSELRGTMVVATDVTAQLANVISFVVVYLVPTILLYFLQDRQYRLHKLFKRPDTFIATASIPITATVAIVSAFGIDFLRTLFAQFNIYALESNSFAPTGTIALIFYYCSLTILPAVFEELFFRGVVMHGLRKHGDGFALVISSLLFALAHNNLFMALNAFIMGLIIGYFVMRTGSVVTGILMHLTNNVLTVSLTYLQSNLSPQIDTIAINLIYIICLTLGIIAVVYLVNRDSNMFALIENKSNFTISTKIRYASGNVFMMSVFLVYLFNLPSTFTNL